MIEVANKYMTWTEIQEKYPDQWVGLESVEYEEDNNATIESAIVKYLDKSKDELTKLQIETKEALIAIYTTPDNIFQLGGLV